MINRRPWKIILTALLIVAIWIIGAWVSFLYTPLITDEHGMKYTVREGSSIRAVADDLYVLNVIKHPYFFKLLIAMKGVVHQLKFGEYLFPKGSTPSTILKQISSGSGMFYYSFMIVPGWDFKEVRAALQRNPNLHHTIQNMSNSDIMKLLGHPELNPEGEFFPDTYYFVDGSSDITLLKRSFKAMQIKLNAAWQHRAPGLPFNTPYEALIGASIVEKRSLYRKRTPCDCRCDGEPFEKRYAIAI